MSTSTEKSFFELTSFENNTLVVSSRRHKVEVLNFNIISQSTELINGIEHTRLLSDNNDIFFVVDGKFHREDDHPAVICKRLILGFCPKKLEKAKCLMWIKNGVYHRDNKLPAVIYEDGNLMWFVNGHWSNQLAEQHLNFSLQMSDGSSYNGFFDKPKITFTNATCDLLDVLHYDKELFIFLNFEKYTNS